MDHLRVAEVLHPLVDVLDLRHAGHRQDDEAHVEPRVGELVEPLEHEVPREVVVHLVALGHRDAAVD